MRHSQNISRFLSLAAALTAASAFAEAPAPSTPVEATTARSITAPDPRTQFWFGVAVENIPPAISKQLKLKPSQGMMVSAVLPGSPAEKAGLQAEDLLIEINGAPLTSQNDLFRAANPAASKKAAPKTKTCQLTYLREGDRATIDITPAQRPSNMIVFDSQDKPNSATLRNYVLPNGGGAQIGPGYHINLAASDGSDFTVKSIKSIVSKGQTVILSQDTDIAGNVKNTITVGASVYTVDPLHLEALPADLRPLAQQLIDGTPAAVQPTTPKPAVATTDASLEQRVKELEVKNADLVKRLNQLMQRDDKELPKK